MKINKERFIDTINKKWSTKKCPMCGNNNWNISEDMMTMLGVDDKKSIRLGGKVIPIVAVTCNECGNTVFVNPLVIHCIDE